MATKQCSKCGDSFGCTAPVAGCWCEQYSVSTPVLAHLKANYTDCLCPKCLTGFAENEVELPQMPVNQE